MIDLHTHLLPYIDDGAANIEEAMVLIEHLLEQEVTAAVCTPHFDPSTIALEEFIMKRDHSMELLKASSISLIPASETYYHDYLFHYSDISKLSIRNTTYLLLELPFERRWKEDLFIRLKDLIHYFNIIPIIAHIERYPAVNKAAILKLLRMGCLMQLNTSSLINPKLRRRTINYINHGYIALLGSDCHNIRSRPPLIRDAINILNNLGEGIWEAMMENAEKVIQDIDIRK